MITWIPVILIIIVVSYIAENLISKEIRRRRMAAGASVPRRATATEIKAQIAALEDLKAALPMIFKNKRSVANQRTYKTRGYDLDFDKVLSHVGFGEGLSSYSRDAYEAKYAITRLKNYGSSEWTKFITPVEVTIPIPESFEELFFKFLVEALGEDFHDWARLELWANHPKRNEEDITTLCHVMVEMVTEAINNIYDNEASDVTDARLKAKSELFGVNTIESKIAENKAVFGSI